jgi:hypothetical protein
MSSLVECSAPELEAGRWHLPTFRNRLFKIFSAVEREIFLLLPESDLTSVRVTLRLPVYCQPVLLGDKPLETHDQLFYFQNEYLLL